jgi:DnaJ-class molecular chaperone
MGGGAGNFFIYILDFDPFSMFFNRGQQENVKRKCKARLVQMKVTLKEVYIGAKKSFEFSRRIVCKPCNGTGSANPAANNKCSGCGGKGMKVVMQRMGHMLLQSQQTCGDCNGEGQVIKDKCKTCKGEKVQYTTKKIDIQLDKGIPDGHRYNFSGDGDEYPDIETGDLSVEIFIEKDNTFVRKGADLIYKSEISLLQALTGVSFVITHLNGSKILIKNKEGEVIKPGVFKTIKELGMPFHNAPYKNGNLFIDFVIDFPEKLNEEESLKLAEVK